MQSVCDIWETSVEALSKLWFLVDLLNGHVLLAIWDDGHATLIRVLQLEGEVYHLFVKSWGGWQVYHLFVRCWCG